MTKPTGVPTLGNVPEHWSVRQNKTFLREVVDLSTTGEEELLTVSHLTGVTSRSEKDVNMFMAESLVGYKRCRPGDLVINTMWAWMGAFGTATQSGIVSPAYGVYRFDESVAVPAYFDLLFRTRGYVTEMTRHSRGIWSSRLRLYPDVFLSLRSPVPPREEQEAIVARASEAKTPLVTLMDAVDESVALLITKRQSLITATITDAIAIDSYRRGGKQRAA